MLTLDAAYRRLLARAHPTEPESVPLAEALGRVLADPKVTAAIDVPGFDNSAMDGYAVRAADTPGGLKLAGEITAGASALRPVEPGTAVRIMTGAPIPPGADAVVPVEIATEADTVVEVGAAVPGDHVRLAAHDTRAGDEICLPEALTPPMIAVLASIGIGEVRVRRRPRVAILSTGDELVDVGQALASFQIHDANGVALAAAVREVGGEPVLLPRARDDASEIERVLTRGARDADLIVTSGGVSVGRHDHVRSVLETRGSLDFWRIAVQPGKPLAVGAIGGTTVIGLPGNPVSALVVFELFVRPVVRAMSGLTGDGRLHLRATPTTRIAKDPQRRAFLRVTVWHEDGQMHARPAGGQASSQLRPLAEANALLAVPEGADAAEPGRSYEAIVLGPLDLAHWR
ncbi:MAG TPA: gephyrin-like molybdotransferase Glp [Candidatus Limnocylindria bacterium]|nr:gephyrin-like molybdotransferase Glp [Candidatus Limnocylindria bacterium]